MFRTAADARPLELSDVPAFPNEALEPGFPTGVARRDERVERLATLRCLAEREHPRVVEPR